MSTGHHQRPSGIEGLAGREPIGAALTVGTKGANGAPTDRDRWYFKAPNMDGSGRRPEHPRFSAYHALDVGHRKTIPGVLVHAVPADCFEYGLAAQVLPGLAHPGKMPSCAGDGKSATRWNGSAFDEIACPHDACEFRQERKGKVPCKPMARFLFRTNFPGEWGTKLPALLVKFSTHSWNTVRNLIGFFDYLSAQALALGVSDPSFYGLTFELALTEKTNSERKSRFPVVTISPTFDVQALLMEQSARRALLASPQPVALLTDDAPAVVAADAAEISPGLRPDLAVDVVDAETVGACPCGSDEWIAVTGAPDACGGCGVSRGANVPDGQPSLPGVK